MIPPVLPASVRFLGELTAAVVPPVLGPDDLRRALAKAIWPNDRPGPCAYEVVDPDESVCIVVSDQTRKTACDQILSLLLPVWSKGGIELGDISILVATGIHRPPTPAECESIVGPVTYRLLEGRVYSHDPDDVANLVHVGNTPLGHPVRVNRRVVESDRLILLGAASFHYHAGFGGGRKLLVPGSASRDTIAYNHSLTLDPHADRIRPGVAIGQLDGNLVSDEMTAGARLCEPDLLINTVLLPDGRSIVSLHSGDLNLAHRAACDAVSRLYCVDIPEMADIVLADATGAPNWIQSHKALYHASLACKPDGLIILVAPCPEGLGDEGFRKWMELPDTAGLFRRLREAPEILGQTALSTRERSPRTLLVTTLNEQDCRTLGMRTAPSVESALQLAVEQMGRAGKKSPTLYTMPHARHTVPRQRSTAM